MLNHDKGAAPLYYQVKEILREQIESGEYALGDKLLSEAKLQEHFQVSRITIRQAITDLVNEGYLQRSRGTGTIVVFDKINENLKKIMSFSEEMKLRGISLETKLCSIVMQKASRLVSQHLLIPENEQVYKLVRLRCVKGSPIVYSITYLNKKLNLSLDASQYEDSLYRLLDEQYGIQVVKGKETFESVSANEEMARYLEVSPGSPLLKRTRITFDQRGDTIEYTLCYYRGDKYKYSVELS